jgi:hypothetical protein
MTKKLDMTLVPPTFLPAVALAFEDGAAKHGGRCNWRDGDPVPVSDILPGLLRHIVAYQNGEDFASDSGVSHLAHLAARVAILIDLEAVGMLVDDRVKLPADRILELERTDDDDTE